MLGDFFTLKFSSGTTGVQSTGEEGILPQRRVKTVSSRDWDEEARRVLSLNLPFR